MERVKSILPIPQLLLGSLIASRGLNSRFIGRQMSFDVFGSVTFSDDFSKHGQTVISERVITQISTNRLMFLSAVTFLRFGVFRRIL